MLQTNWDVLFIGKVGERWFVAPPRRVETTAWLPLEARTAGEALAVARLLFPESMVAVKCLTSAA